MKLEQLGVTLNAANLLESNRLSWIRMDITIINEAIKLTTVLENNKLSAVHNLINQHKTYMLYITK